MHPNPRFLNRSNAFWGYAQLISEKLKYSKGGNVKTYTSNDVIKKLNELDINLDDEIVKDVLDYLNFRADILNNKIKHFFMDVEKARYTFKRLHNYYQEQNFTCSLPFNKQKREKKDYAYFTCIINILTEKYLRKYADANGLVYGKDIYFDDDPRQLTYLKDENNYIGGILSRRFDGAFPETINPKAIWEIKEYYYTTTFGSRIADGVYETQLDGHEINELAEFTKDDINHIYFIDDYNTWWNMGKSYLCRIIDMLHKGLVDEVIFGEEVLLRWEYVLSVIVEGKKSDTVEPHNQVVKEVK
ncbi:hypothetical protein [Alkalihalobacillus sp. AL-G]|uniref:DUF7687 domain-containing protein n=1 Tax=Alkalihalobacillus sp. AL-G TaxID=2926399 RepID=UPI00272C1247|nr:hypothetical protein [Alkalihalobacillus sp. AL-G]WLD91759.1 hypothetical protein MOJ78_11990 [Alkalihalobacillus sp. AL-G]